MFVFSLNDISVPVSLAFKVLRCYDNISSKSRTDQISYSFKVRLDASLKKEILIKDYLPNYKINLLDAGSVEDVSRFRTDLQQVFGMLKYRGEKEKLQRYMQENRDYFGQVDVETYQALGAFLHSGKKLKEVVDSGEEEQIDMCKALDDIYADGVRDEKFFIITRMIKEGMAASVIRKCTEATEQEIEQARNEMKIERQD